MDLVFENEEVTDAKRDEDGGDGDEERGQAEEDFPRQVLAEVLLLVAQGEYSEEGDEGGDGGAESDQRRDGKDFEAKKAGPLRVHASWVGSSKCNGRNQGCNNGARCRGVYQPTAASFDEARVVMREEIVRCLAAGIHTQEEACWHAVLYKLHLKNEVGKTSKYILLSLSQLISQ